MVHQPPTGLGMHICADGRQVGSPTVLKFIENNQPLLGCLPPVTKRCIRSLDRHDACSKAKFIFNYLAGVNG